ncbi:FG-GAP repeat domain-containing protein [Streptomyces sp. NPDC056503]|uniref:FG-GAP repeat domain-containing protein n=1 Tax=Streptomyces sp. NPDC056503 TaxID=3345842 RepID=UPI0036CD36B8
MTSVRSGRSRRLGASVALVLATTLGAGALTAGPAGAAVNAAPQAPQATPTADGPGVVPSFHKLLGGGKHGAFTMDGNRYDHQDPTYGRLTYTRYTDGTTIELDLISAEDRVVATGDTGAVINPFERSVTVFDGARGGSYTLPVDEDTYDLREIGLAGGGLLAVSTTGPEPVLKLHTVAEGSRVVDGMPGKDAFPALASATDTHALVLTKDARGAAVWVVVDLAAAKVVETHAVPAAADPASVTFADRRIAWAEYPEGAAPRAVVRDRSGGGETVLPLPAAPGRDYDLGLVGDWLTYSRPGGLAATTPSPARALTARHLTGGESFELLDHTVRSTDSPAGGQTVWGGSVAAGENGEGVYRITAGADGVPTAVQEATTRQSTALRPGSSDLPHEGKWIRPVNGVLAPTRFDFALNRGDVRVDAVFRHQDGGTLTRSWTSKERNVRFDWDHHLGSTENGEPRHSGAPSGSYQVSFTFTPLNGIGPAAQVKGQLALELGVRPHGFDFDTTPDLLARDSSGVLWTDSTVMTPQGELDARRARVGGGWQAYDRIEATGDIARSQRSDIVARDRSGVLWFYESNGYGRFYDRSRIGGGWQVYDLLAGGSDLTGDGRPDLLATDRTGVLWLYRSTGDVEAPFAARKKVGAGWGVYNQLTATGDIAGTTGGDLLARDKDGVLWMYLGKGDGTFTGRTRVGGGWNAYTELVGGGDADNDGKADLFAYSAREKKTYLYGGTGDRARPFKARKANTVFAGGSYNLFG